MTETMESGLLTCYNKGCGQKFNPVDNKEDSCTYHPGAPIFHDAYKSWSCCKKRCIDFTEFLNIKGCTKSLHSSEKPPEPEKPAVDKSKADEVIEYRAPMNSLVSLKRPPFETAQTTLSPVIAPALLNEIEKLTLNKDNSVESEVVQFGESCKNKGCTASYKDSEADEGVCVHHPGVPIFHEGLKYWSCCPKKKLTDFSVFLALPGCTSGKHLWKVKNTGKKIQCRMDWHQTVSSVVIAIYAKKYLPSKSFVKLSPVRLTVSLWFPEAESSYDLDLELAGVVDVEKTHASMLATKLEITLKKAEPGSWAKLDIPRSPTEQVEKPKDEENEDDLHDRVDAVDLSDL